MAVIADHVVGRIQNPLAGTIIFLQLDNPGMWKILFKLQDIADIRTSPAIDGLIIISYHTDILTGIRQQLNQHILGKIGILIFIYQYIMKFIPIIIQYIRMKVKQLQGFVQQIIKIQSVVLLQAHFVRRINAGKLLLPVLACYLLCIILRTFQIILQASYGSPDLFWRKVLFIDIPFPETIPDDGKLIRIVVNDKAAGIAEFINVPAQNTHTGGVKRTDPDRGSILSHQTGNPCLHFPGSFIGKGKCQNSGRINPAKTKKIFCFLRDLLFPSTKILQTIFQYHNIPVGEIPGDCLALISIPESHDMGNPVGQNSRFAGSGTGQDQKRPFRCQYGLPLHIVQMII